MFPINAAGLGLALLLAVSPGPARAQQHDHTAEAHSTGEMLPPVVRWTADADLRDGMGRIRTALEELRHYEMGHMDATMALDRVALIQQAARDIFARCKLTPEKDAVMHGMLVPLLAAAQKFEADPQDLTQVQAMRTAVADYPRYFDDPGWAAVKPHDH